MYGIEAQGREVAQGLSVINAMHPRVNVIFYILWAQLP